MTIKEIGKPVKQHLDKFDKFYKDAMKSDVTLLNLVLSYVSKKKGKQVRPVLVFLAADLCGGVNERSYVGAAMVELLHNATLIHDDVVDEASERRGMASINASWNNKIAVLIGDYLLSRGLLTSVENDEVDFLRVTSNAVKKMSEGELLQIQKSKDFKIDEKTYFQIISYKTASLMSSCCEIGAISSSDDPEVHEKLRRFGELVGLAFQIRDDIFDYKSSSSLIGKPVGNDLKEKKITLPLIYSFSKTETSASKVIVRKIKNGNLSKDDIVEIVNFATDNGGIDYAEARAREFTAEAVSILQNFPDSEAKTSLIDFANFVVDREK